jgi:DNA-binding transcriptional ArsR family regulator
LLKALADPESASILAATATGPRSAQEIVKGGDLPQSSTYRRLHELQDAGLIVVAKTVLKSDGKSYQMYKATFREVRVAFRGGELLVEGEPNSDVVERAFRLFHSFTEGP